MAKTKATASTKTAAPVKAAAPKAVKVPKAAKVPVAHGVGRRKSSVARVWLYRGNGAFLVNGKDYKKYFDTEVSRLEASAPLAALPSTAVAGYNVEVNVIGGGLHGQAGAVKVGIARALVESNPDLRSPLRQHGMLTVDARLKERKKYGQKAARRKFQFVKR